MEGEFKFLEHTADLGIEVTSPTLDGVYELAGRALFELILPENRSLPEEPSQNRRILVETEGADAEALLVNFLNDLLAEFEINGWVFRSIKVQERDALSLKAEACYEEPDLEKRRPETIVKAVTWHDLKIEKTGDRWKGVVYPDL